MNTVKYPELIDFDLGWIKQSPMAYAVQKTLEEKVFNGGKGNES